jgi:hypothetical protein
MDRKRVFISWSGKTGNDIAELLKKTFFMDHPQLEAWVSSVDIGSGQPFRTALTGALQGMDFGIGIMTPGASRKPWVNFEAGFLFARLQNFKVMLFNENVEGPLQDLQWVDGTTKDGLIRLFKDMLIPVFPDEYVREKQARNWVASESQRNDWDGKLRALLAKDEYLLPIKQAMEAIQGAGERLCGNERVRDNVCFRHVVEQSLKRTQAQLAGVDSSYTVPAAHYADYLVSLQRGHGARVQALAMINAICHVAHGLYPQSKKVFGIASEMKLDPTCSYDFCLIEGGAWTDQDQQRFELLRNEFGILANPVMGSLSEDEYPGSPN